jgi:selenocysteine lyase/cysteine desulfurase
MESVSFGLQASALFFPHHKNDFIRLNNGSFGSPPASVLAQKRELETSWNAQPDGHYFYDLTPNLERSTEAVASFVNCPRDNLCLVDNATTSAVMVTQLVAREFSLGECKSGDVILTHSFIYAAVAKILRHYLQHLGAEIVEVPLPFPVTSDDEVIDAYKRTLDTLQGRRIRLAVLDHISSIPSILFPLKGLTELLRERGVNEIFVDGAHAVGAVPVDLETIDCDYYTSNCHKWLFCPASVAFFYARDTEKIKREIHHPVVSHNLGQGLWMECAWVGTRDYSSMEVVPYAIEFMQALGVERVMKYNHELAWKAAETLAKKWNTQVGSPQSMISSLSSVQLPEATLEEFPDPLVLRQRLRDSHRIESYPFIHEGRYWVRLSAQIYNREEDYEAFFSAINSVLSS